MTRPRSVAIRFTPGELQQLFFMVDNSYEHGEWVRDYMKGASAYEKNCAHNAYGKVRAALQGGGG